MQNDPCIYTALWQPVHLGKIALNTTNNLQ